LVYCWRGGQRSGSLATVLAAVGWQVDVLEGGYREYRRRVVADLATAGTDLDLRIVCGTTGSGKSRLLVALGEAGAQVLDLEALARHRGSVLGALPGQAQPTQKAFETALWSALRGFDRGRPVFVESESRTIGRLRLPEALLAHMRASPCLRIEMPVAARVALLCEDYAHFVADRAALVERLRSLREARGAAVVDRWVTLAESGRVDELVEALLVQHYDPIYLKSMGRNFGGFQTAAVIELADGSRLALSHAATTLAG
jgi:tRNA 2-selenouridine synthase